VVRGEKEARAELGVSVVLGLKAGPEVSEQTVRVPKGALVMADEAEPLDEEAKGARAVRDFREALADGAKIFRSLTRRALLALTGNYMEEPEATRVTRETEGRRERTDPAGVQGRKLQRLIVHHRLRWTAHRHLLGALWAVANRARAER